MPRRSARSFDSKIGDLKSEITEVRDTIGDMSDEDAFCAWFVWAYLVDRLDQVKSCLTGGPNDKGIDAIVLDENLKRAFIVQSKFRHSLMASSEGRNDVVGFASLAPLFLGPRDDLKTYLSGGDGLLSDLAFQVWDRCRNRNYRLELCYVSTGKFTPGVRDAAESAARKASGRTARLSLIDGRGVVRILDDFLDGVAPPVPFVDVPIETGKGSGIIDYYDPDSDIESWVFTAKGTDVGRLFTQAQRRIFARNIRGFLGNTAINHAMEGTLAREPEHFLYFNNGVTILCDDAIQESARGAAILRISNPQIINGQQTTRVLAEAGRDAGKASVLVRVIKVPRAQQEDDAMFDQLVSQIVGATNYQNQIRESDLRANDRQQVFIERELRKLGGYLYLRKRQSKGEARRSAGRRTDIIIKKDEIARAVAACELDPAIVREGTETLFSERYYARVFPSTDPHFYLIRFWLMRAVLRVAKGSLERTYSRWVVLHFIFSDLGRDLKPLARQFETVMQRPRRHPREAAQIDRLVTPVVLAAVKFYRTNHVESDVRLDPNTFFRRQGRGKEFEAYWKSRANSRRQPYNNVRHRLLEYLREVEI